MGCKEKEYKGERSGTVDGVVDVFGEKDFGFQSGAATALILCAAVEFGRFADLGLESLELNQQSG